MVLKVETHNFESLVACFWQVENNQWEGIVPKEINNTEVQIIKSDRAIIILKKSDCIQNLENCDNRSNK